MDEYLSLTSPFVAWVDTFPDCPQPLHQVGALSHPIPPSQKTIPTTTTTSLPPPSLSLPLPFPTTTPPPPPLRPAYTQLNRF